MIEFIDNIKADSQGFVFARKVTRTPTEEGISDSYHRVSFYPGQDVSDQDNEIQMKCTEVWTASVIEDYKKSLSN
jgi:hypothetical protein